MRPRRRRERGIVLLAVLFFAMLLVGSTATFLRRAAIDTLVIRNRDAAARAEALARGGVRLGQALVLEDLLFEQADEDMPAVESLHDVWALASALEIPAGEDAALQLHIEDAGARLNLNALFAEGAPRGDGDEAEIFLTSFLEKVIDEMPGRPEDKLYDPQELARSLIDWIDEDDERIQGGLEDDYYQRQDPPYRAANGPLLSVQELRLVEGFDGPLVEAMEPYVGVFPLVGGEGINPNTAESFVLALVFHDRGDAGENELANQDEVGDLVKVREDDLLSNESSELSVGLRDATHGSIANVGSIYPPPGYRSNVFRVRAEATVGEIRRRVEVVIDRTDPVAPQRLAWRMW